MAKQPQMLFYVLTLLGFISASQLCFLTNALDVHMIYLAGQLLRRTPPAYIVAPYQGVGHVEDIHNVRRAAVAGLKVVPHPLIVPASRVVPQIQAIMPQ